MARFLALSNINDKFFYTKNERLSNLIFHKYNYQPQGVDILAVIRHESLLSDIDRSQFVVNQNFTNYTHLSNFYQLEKHPKIRNCTYANDVVKELYHK